MEQDHTRRTVLQSLSALGIGLFSGCSAISDTLTGPPPDVVVFNRTRNSITASIEVTNQGNGNTILSETADISSNNAAEYPDALPASGEYTITVETGGGLAGTHQWSISSDDQSMQVRVNSESINFDSVSS